MAAFRQAARLAVTLGALVLQMPEQVGHGAVFAVEKAVEIDIRPAAVGQTVYGGIVVDPDHQIVLPEEQLGLLVVLIPFVEVEIGDQLFGIEPGVVAAVAGNVCHALTQKGLVLIDRIPLAVLA